MKTTQYFDDKIETATIVVNQNHLDTYKSMLERRKVEIEQETFNEKENYTVFVVKGLLHADLHLFDENNTETCYVHYYVVRRGKLRVQVYTQSTHKKSIYVSHISVSLLRDENNSKTIAEIYSDKDILGDKPKSYGVNWGAWGTTDIPTTQQFALGIQLAVGLAEDCQRQFC